MSLGGPTTARDGEAKKKVASMSDRSPSVNQRAKRPNSMYSYCRIVGCPHPARAGTEKGLDRLYCRRHADHFSRHGSYIKRSYRAVDLKPYRKTVRTWLKANRDDLWVRNAIVRVQSLYNSAGRFEEAFRLRGMDARERGRKAWARLRHAGIAPEKALEAWLVIELAVALDEQPESKPEFKRVQAAKIVHRLASGSHKRWETPINPRTGGARGQTVTTEMHVYPHSRGRVLRHIGADLEDACGLVVMEHIGALVGRHAGRG